MNGEEFVKAMKEGKKPEEVLTPEEMGKVKAAFIRIQFALQAVERVNQNIRDIIARADPEEITELSLFISDIVDYQVLLNEEVKKPVYEGLSLYELVDLCREDEKYIELLKNALATVKKLDKVSYRKIDGLPMITSLLANAYNKGEREENYRKMQQKKYKYDFAGRRKRGQPEKHAYMDVLVTTVPDESRKKPKLIEFEDFFSDPREFLCMCICDSLYANNERVVTPNIILHYLGVNEHTSNDSVQTISILDVLEKAAQKWIVLNTIDVLRCYHVDEEEVATYKVLKGYLIPLSFEYDKFVINGGIAAVKINILDYSPFYKISRLIGQMTQWDLSVFTGYKGRRTPRYYTILYFLLRRIGQIRGEKGREGFITYENMYQYCCEEGASRWEKQDSRDMTRKILEQSFSKYIEVDSIHETPSDEKYGLKFLKKSG